MPSVTEVLDTFPERELVEWMLRDPKKAKKISEEALRVGTLVDKLIQAQWRKESVELTLDSLANDLPVMAAWSAWTLYCQQHPMFFPSITAIQEELTDGLLVGHPDLTCQWDGGWGTVSIKCSAAIRPIYWTQEAGYAVLRGLQFPSLGFPRFLGILRLDKVSGQPEYQELTAREDIEYEMQVFRDYYRLYEHRETVKERTRVALEQERLCITG